MTIQLLGVPIDSAGGAIGTTFMPAVLRETGVVAALGAEDLGDLDTLIEPPERDRTTGIVGSDSVLRVTRTIREAVRRTVDPADLTVILGGCCSLAVGAIAGLRDAVEGDVGVVYCDGHLDLYDGHNSPTGEAADMPLAVALGLGPTAWVEAAGGRLLEPGDVALLGFRDLDEAKGFGSVTPADLPGMLARNTDAIRRDGPGRTAAEARASVAPDDRPFAVFVDLDILDPSVFPNDAPVPDGIDWPDLRDLLTPLVSDPACLALAVACYNPERDPERESAGRIVELLKDVAGPRG
jgi:arginase